MTNGLTFLVRERTNPTLKPVFDEVSPQLLPRPATMNPLCWPTVALEKLSPQNIVRLNDLHDDSHNDLYNEL